MRFYLGTHEPAWVYHLRIPLFISARRLRRRPLARRAIGPWALDSGGFTELDKFGRWTISPEQYADEISAWSERIGGMEWAAPQDWMCEPLIRRKTGLSVAEHQRRTIDNVIRLRELGAAQVIPVLQGWTLLDYTAHVQQYADAGFRLTEEPLVGVGSVCRRQATTEAVEIFRELSGMGFRLHGFGVKKLGLIQMRGMIASADSMAWSIHARHVAPLPGHTHKTCANCREFALMWRGQLLHRLTGAAPGETVPLFYSP